MQHFKFVNWRIRFLMSRTGQSCETDLICIRPIDIDMTILKYLRGFSLQNWMMKRMKYITREGWVMCIFYSSLFPNKRMLIQISNSLFEALLKARSDYLRNRLKLSSFVLGLDNVKKQKKSEYASGSLIFFSSKSKINQDFRRF